MLRCIPRRQCGTVEPGRRAGGGTRRTTLRPLCLLLPSFETMFTHSRSLQYVHEEAGEQSQMNKGNECVERSFFHSIKW